MRKSAKENSRTGLRAFSDAAPEKRKRGRPPAFRDALREYLCRSIPKHSRRAQVNHCYRIKAIWRILHSGRRREFVWLIDMRKQRTLRLGMSKPELLSELGRIRTGALCLAVAGVLCKVRPKTKAGVAYVRALRLKLMALERPRP